MYIEMSSNAMAFERVIEKMLEYQRINNIRHNCIVNAVYLVCVADQLNIKAELQAVMVLYKPKGSSFNDDATTIQEVIPSASHFVVKTYDDKIIECSYDASSIGCKYYGDVASLLRDVDFTGREYDKRKLIEEFLEFKKDAEAEQKLINKGLRSSFNDANDKYWKAQDAYVKQFVNIY
jgi:hypothetical protein